MMEGEINSLDALSRNISHEKSIIRETSIFLRQ